MLEDIIMLDGTMAVIGVVMDGIMTPVLILTCILANGFRQWTGSYMGSGDNWQVPSGYKRALIVGNNLLLDYGILDCERELDIVLFQY